MSSILKGIEVIFKVLLFAVLMKIVYEQLRSYIDNNDASSIFIQKFKSHKENLYPTISICIVDYNGLLFQTALGNLSKSYWNYARGASGIEKTKDFSKIDYDDVVMDVRKMLMKYQRKSKGMNGNTRTEIFLDFQKVFRISYQNHNMVCFTKKEWEEDARIIKYELVKFDYPWLSSTHSHIHAYIHHKGQLIRSLSMPTVMLFGKSLANGKLKGHQGFQYILRVRCNAISIIRKRPDAIQKCDQSLVDDDIKWHEVLSEKVQCIPIFSKKILRNSTKLNLLPTCDFQRQRQGA